MPVFSAMEVGELTQRASATRPDLTVIVRNRKTAAHITAAVQSMIKTVDMSSSWRFSVQNADAINNVVFSGEDGVSISQSGNNHSKAQ
jgi:hypothetical protein